MMQQPEQGQEVLQNQAEQRHQQGLEEIKSLLTSISLCSVKITSNINQDNSTGAKEDSLEDLRNLKHEFILQAY